MCPLPGRTLNPVYPWPPAHAGSGSRLTAYVFAKLHCVGAGKPPLPLRVGRQGLRTVPASATPVTLLSDLEPFRLEDQAGAGRGRGAPACGGSTQAGAWGGVHDSSLPATALGRPRRERKVPAWIQDPAEGDDGGPGGPPAGGRAQGTKQAGGRAKGRGKVVDGGGDEGTAEPVSGGPGGPVPLAGCSKAGVAAVAGEQQAQEAGATLEGGGVLKPLNRVKAAPLTTGPGKALAVAEAPLTKGPGKAQAVAEAPLTKGPGKAHAVAEAPVGGQGGPPIAKAAARGRGRRGGCAVVEEGR